ncbi:MAG: lipid A deacylase LpxR family protein, partial [Desulfobacteraceae bacterium]|nr:lipid A deacylase LpxR family protein [Desulfobacteraceae bacterium]
MRKTSLNTKRIRMKIALAALLALCTVGCVAQSAAAYDGALTLIVENDCFTNSDNNYTNGVGISWVSAGLDTYDHESFLGKWGRFWAFLPFVSDEGYTTYASWSVVQEMHTPDDIADPNPPGDDQPYAGVLYVDNLLYARRERWGHAWELKLGVAGPSSQAENAQKQVHKLIGSEDPQGWHTQVPNEPVINLGYTVGYLAAERECGRTGRMENRSCGNRRSRHIFHGAGLGIYGEAGWNLADAFGGAALRTGLNAASTAGVGPVDGWSSSIFRRTRRFRAGACPASSNTRSSCACTATASRCSASPTRTSPRTACG